MGDIYIYIWFFDRKFCIFKLGIFTENNLLERTFKNDYSFQYSKY